MQTWGAEALVTPPPPGENVGGTPPSVHLRCVITYFRW